jgi:hypothetical protein
MEDAHRSAPRVLCEMHPWLAVGTELAQRLAPICSADLLDPEDWERQARGEAAFLLVEAAPPWEEYGEKLDRLLEVCERTGTPAMLWATGSPISPEWLDRCRSFTRVFTVDGEQRPALEAAGAERPQTLWPGASLPPGETPICAEAERTDAVLWLGGWSPGWPEPWRERLASVLRGAARRGLRIVEAGDLDGLPADLSEHVDGTIMDGGGETALRSARIVIGADHRSGAAKLAPSVVFDAAAAGASSITPHDFALPFDFMVGKTVDMPPHNLLPKVHDAEAAVHEIDKLLEDNVLYSEVVDYLHRIVAYNHTAAHRLATLASVAGVRLVPDARHPAPA